MNRYSNHSDSRLGDFHEWLDLNEKSLSIIEFGVGSGKTLNEIHDRYPKSKLVGFDINPPALSNQIKLIRADLNLLELGDYHQDISNADVFLFLDILEHLNDPFRIISEILLRSKPGSKIIISSPNFASVRMLIAWLQGRMPLNEFGYFDRTHLHWLSHKDEFFKGLRVDQIIRSYVFSKKPIFRFLQKLMPSRLCTQFLAVIVK